MAHPPSYPQVPVLGSLPAFYPWLKKGQMFMFLRHGNSELNSPIVTHNLFGNNEFHVSDPATIRRILTSPDFARSDFLIKNSKDLFRYFLFGMASDPVWKKHRKAIQSGMGPQFVRKSFTATVVLMADLVNMWNARLMDPEAGAVVVDIRDYLSAVTLDVIARVAFDFNVACLEKMGSASVKRTSTVQHHVNQLSRAMVLRLFMPKMLYPLFRVTKQALRASTKYFMDMVGLFLESRQKKAKEEVDGDGDGDLLGILLKNDQDGKPTFSEQEIQHEVLAIMLAGHDTTSNTLTNVFLHLTQNPSIVAKLEQEIQDVLGTDKSQPLEFADLPKFKYVENTFKEAQRINPVIMGADRVATTDVEVLGYKFKKGAYFSCNLQWASLNPSIWGPDAHVFNPDRFDSPDVPNAALMPFSAGPHMCPGFKMAQMEAKVVLIELVRNFGFELVEGQRLKFEDGVTIHLAEGLKVRVVKKD
ncbi:hypothetical protein CcCBS67573_g09394 [Chytriomyces confervae]|uniref:Cytochrome P450 n=1 Tax=Chytriomyces confervae TaxID=246404 RepID=A0A507DWD0_9FUNG|nr:hypothetical protein HDU80_004609 [Chytriomyces hyalinus]TPX56024.1 hypothetical protein CcCBS67573_g09394 [Chytriomyces confervae]